MTRILAGPYCSMLFADLGAEVIKIEPPEGEMIRDNPPRVQNGKGGPHDRSRSAYFLSLNRNKYGITLNLKHPRAVKIFKDLVPKSDVVLENYAPGVMKRLGIDYPVLKEINPRIVMCSISGFGQWGPDSQKTAFDIVAQATGGLMSVTGNPDVSSRKSRDLHRGPQCRRPCRLCHHGGVVASGKNRGGPAYRRFHAGNDGFRYGRGRGPLDRRPGAYAAHRLAQHQRISHGRLSLQDGYIIIGTVGNEHFQRFCRAIGKPEWMNRPEYATKGLRWARKWEMQKEIEEITAQYTVKEVGEMMDRERVANAPILNIQQVVEDPHLNARGYFVEVEHPIIGKAKIRDLPSNFPRRRETSKGRPLWSGSIMKRFSGNTWAWQGRGRKAQGTKGLFKYSHRRGRRERREDKYQKAKAKDAEYLVFLLFVV